jgi:hypothetical protein
MGDSIIVKPRIEAAAVSEGFFMIPPSIPALRTGIAG